ncbi:MAG TPA: patatin-like phospholipase family protein [Terriglobales bacterium]|nr:patatin-like phospholipase family protein [Terriglobales bacterium]
MGTLGKLRRSLQVFKRELTRVSPPASAPVHLPTPQIGLALGGGFARGLAHIGVLKALEEENVPIACVAGTSVGAVIGAAYCSGMSAAELAEMAALVRFRDFARWTISRYGFASNERMVGFLKRTLKVRSFEELRIPLAVTATDFISGEGVVFRSGQLIEPVRASCAYPGMFLPVQINGRLLVDGMLAHTVPTVPLHQMGANKVIGVYLRSHWCDASGPRHVFEVISQCFSIAQEQMSGLWRGAADVIVEPDVAGFGYDSFERAPELIRAGEAAARAAMPQIRAWLQPHPVVAEDQVRERKPLQPHTSPVPAD